MAQRLLRDRSSTPQHRRLRAGRSCGRAHSEQESPINRFTHTSLLAASVLLVFALFSTGCGKTVGDTIDDATITTRVKTSLLNDPDIGGLAIDVDTFQGVVTLSGRVKTVAEQGKAIRLTRNTPGVTTVKNALQVLPGTE